MNNIKYRKFCNVCKSYQLFDKTNDKLQCDVCSSIATDSNLNEIDNIQILEQRERYKKSYVENIVNQITKKTNVENVVIEDSAEYDLNIENMAILNQEISKQVAEYNFQYTKKLKLLGRNSLCICGSGLKYKKCCKP